MTRQNQAASFRASAMVATNPARQNVRLIATRASLPNRQSSLTLDAPKG